MTRPDLLALTEDDLVVLTNRGLVRRAKKEAERLESDVEEAGDGTVVVRWADDVVCTLPAGEAIDGWQCTCAATTACRHLLRSVLAYQAAAGDGSPRQQEVGELGAERATAAVPLSPWDPGRIPDAALAEHYRKAMLTRLRGEFEEGHVVELVRSAKPTARFHTLALSVRFLVPDDPRYARCDCEEEAPCRHVPLAVWAFRMLAPDVASGLVSTREIESPVPGVLLAEIDEALTELARVGVAGMPQALTDRLRRLAARASGEGLIWPAEVLTDLVQAREQYARGDARFAPRRVAALVGEMLIRSAAVRAGAEAGVPQLFVRGGTNDRETRVGTARLVGLGCGAELAEGHVRLSAYLQDTDSGDVLVVRRDFDDPADDEEQAPALWRLAGRSGMVRTPLATLGAANLIVKGGRRLPSGEFVPGRASAVANPQAYRWESLRSPLLVDGFTELQAHLAARPIASLRPRRIADSLFVCPVARAEDVRFSAVEQAVEAALLDAEGGRARLIHPYTSRGQQGAERLLATLRQRPNEVRFVAGRARLLSAELQLEPVSLVLEAAEGRELLQPWIDRWEEPGGPGATAAQGRGGARAAAAASAPSLGVQRFVADVVAELGDLLLDGLDRVDVVTARAWRALASQGAALGFVRLVAPVDRLAATLSRRSELLDWDWQAAAAQVKELCMLMAVAREVQG
jgi:hypothetical protein